MWACSRRTSSDCGTGARSSSPHGSRSWSASRGRGCAERGSRMTHPMSPSNVLNACVVEPAVSELCPDCRVQLLVSGGVSWFPVAAAVPSVASSPWCVMERRRFGATDRRSSFGFPVFCCWAGSGVIAWCGWWGLLLYCTYVRRWGVSLCPGRWCGWSAGRAWWGGSVGAAGLGGGCGRSAGVPGDGRGAGWCGGGVAGPPAGDRPGLRW